MYVLAGVSGTRSAGVSALRSIGFSPVPFGIRNREEQKDGGRVINNVLIKICTHLVSTEQEKSRSCNVSHKCFCVDWTTVKSH